MKVTTKFASMLISQLLMIFLLLILGACGGDGGGHTSYGIDLGPSTPDGGVALLNPDPPSPHAFINAEQIQAQITGVTIDGPPTVEFTVADQDNVAIIDLTADNLTFTFAKLVRGTNGDSDEWVSYVNQIEEPGVGPGLEEALQATRERGGVLEHLGNGRYIYSFATDITRVTEPVEITYQPDLTHRVAIQFGGGALANPVYTWVPANGATENIHSFDVVATETCNNCHDPIAMHGGGRLEMQYCVSCHNPSTLDANSGNTMDFKVMIHKIHRGASLPSVINGGEYKVWGYRDRPHDYSKIHYPQDIRNCTNCHAGTMTGSEDHILTNQGDNWATRPTMEACGSCHDDVEFTSHHGNQIDNSDCGQCHTPSGSSISVINAHTIPDRALLKNFEYEILSVGNTAPGEFPEITFSVTNPENNDEAYNILSDQEWTETESGASRLAIGIAWDNSDYHNSGNESESSSNVLIDALATAEDIGGGAFKVSSDVAIPDGTSAPFIAAEGSGTVMIEGHPAVMINENETRLAVGNTVQEFSINEADGVPVSRRTVVKLESCNQCHDRIVIHGNNRNDNIEGCVTCHNPRNTDREVRLSALTPPTDGKEEESLDFKTMIHGIHAAGIREKPLQIVGFRGFSTHVYDEDTVHYPGDVGNCLGCHEEGSYTLPLNENVLGTTVDTGSDHQDPTDDLVISPVTAVCSSCHDSTLAKNHMELFGGSFSAIEQHIEAEIVVETCAMCHGPGDIADVEKMHPVHAK